MSDTPRTDAVTLERELAEAHRERDAWADINARNVAEFRRVCAERDALRVKLEKYWQRYGEIE